MTFLNQARFAGKIFGIPERTTRRWMHITHYDTTETQYGMWGGGQGWTGQPLLVRWSSLGGLYNEEGDLYI